jgi:hypothetical protein
MKQLIKRIKKPKDKKKTVPDQDAAGSVPTSNAGSTPSLVAAAAPIASTSTAAIHPDQTMAHPVLPSQPTDAVIVTNKPVEGSHPERTSQELTTEPSTPRLDPTTEQSKGSEVESSQVSSMPKSKEPKPVTRTRSQRVRDGAIIALDFASIISEATDILKPVRAIAGGIKKVLEIPKVCISTLTPIVFTY